VLVGQAPGDVAPPDIGTRPLSKVRPSEKITAAGRYVTEPGRNAQGEDIVWLDYDAALSMHRVRNVPGEHRPERLRTPGTADKRISFGCINVPTRFTTAASTRCLPAPPAWSTCCPKRARRASCSASRPG
jgi:hypothetical protein